MKITLAVIFILGFIVLVIGCYLNDVHNGKFGI